MGLARHKKVIITEENGFRKGDGTLFCHLPEVVEPFQRGAGQVRGDGFSLFGEDLAGIYSGFPGIPVNGRKRWARKSRISG